MINQPAKTYRLAVLIASYNRCETTLQCLNKLFAQQLIDISLNVYLVDDNSQDGTAQAVAKYYPQVTIISGTGSLYWAGAMRLAWQYAAKKTYDFYFWLNDDVVLQSDAIARLVDCYETHSSQRPLVGAVIGALQAAPDRQVSYGGRLQTRRLLPLQFSAHLAVSAQAQPIDIMNGNCCLISAEAFKVIGGICERFTHALADYDYSLRLKRAGFAVLQAPGILGYCRQNGWAGGIRDPRVPMLTRLRWLSMPNKWVGVEEWQYFVRCYGGIFWPYFWAKAALRKVFPRIFLAVNSLAAEQVDPRPQVVILQQVIKKFRLPFYVLLQQRLAEQGIALTVYYSAPATFEARKGDNLSAAELPWFFHEIPCLRLGKLTWQFPPFKHPKQLLIVEQANRHLLNYWLLFQRSLGIRQGVAWWGHGFNHQGRNGWRESCKAWLLGKADHFFAYTQHVADYVQQQGMPLSQITTVNNAIDTETFARQVKRARNVWRNTCLQPKAGLTVLFCGALYAEKRIDLLISTATLLAEQGLLNKLIVLGDGPERTRLLPKLPWLDYRGVLFEEEKAAAYAQADIVLHPGLVGLAILDAFAAELPFVTCYQSNHSPEIAYLSPNINGVIVAPEPQALALALTQLWNTPEMYSTLVAGARTSAAHYSIANMAEAFTQGIQSFWATTV